MDNRTIACRYGDRIRKARSASGMSVAELAAKLKVSRAAVYKWESGDSIPTPQMQLRIAKAVDVPHMALFHLEAVA